MLNSLSTRIFLATSLLVTICVGGASVVTLLQGNQIALTQVSASLERSSQQQRETAGVRFQNLLLLNQLISSDPYFTSYIGQASGSDLGFGGDETETDAASMIDLLEERNETLRFQYGVGFDFAYVLDGEGELLATTSSYDDYIDFYEDEVLKPLIRDIETVTGYWNLGQRVYQVAGVPLASDDELVGFLVLGLEAGEEYVQDIKGDTTTELAVLGPRSENYYPIAGSVDDEIMQYLASVLSSSDHNGQDFEVDFGGEHWIAVLNELSRAQDVGVFVSLVSQDAALESFNELRNLLIIVAVISVILALGAGYMLSVQTVKPLVQLADAAHAASQGDYQTQFDTRDGTDELSVLTNSLDSLLSDLREKNDMEDFVTRLARLQPESEDEDSLAHARKADSRPAERAATLVAFELRDLLESDHEPAELANLAELANKNIELAMRRNGGSIVNSSAYRTFAYFSSGETLKSALGAILAGASHLGAHSIRPVVALTRGRITTASITTGGMQKQISLGKPWLVLERLLSEARPGYVMVTKNTKIAMEAQNLDINAESVEGLVSKKTFLGVPLSSLGTSDTLFDKNTTMVDGTQTNLDSLGVLKPDDIRPGMVVNNRYEVISRIGSGGMGVVYKTYDRELDDVIALKLLSIEQSNTKFIDLMRSEIRLARKVTDQHILRTFDFGEVDGLPYLSMEFVHGLTLSYVIENTGTLPFSAALQIGKQLCAALTAAHKEDIAHRDVKPANLMLDFSGRVKLMDFGLAGTVKGSRTLGGTPRYASPEQLTGQDLGVSGDIYSCGVVLYELFVGELPFNLSGTDLKEIAKLQRSQIPKPPREVKPELPESLEKIIMSCIARDASERPNSIKEVMEVLQDIRA